MKKLGLIIVLLSLGHLSQLSAQTNLNSDIIGDWFAVKVYNIGAVIPSESKEMIEEFQKKLLKSKFSFKKDHNFSFETTVPKMSIKNGHWKILKDNSDIVIQEWKDKDKEGPNLMLIKILFKDGKTIFMMEETFFTFEMEKIK